MLQHAVRYPHENAEVLLVPHDHLATVRLLLALQVKVFLDVWDPPLGFERVELGIAFGEWGKFHGK